MMLAEKEITTYACFIVFYRNPILYLVSHALFYQKNLKSRQCDRTYLFRPADDLRNFSKADPAGHDRGARAARIFSPALRPFSRPACSYLPSVSYQCLPHLIRHKGASPAGMHAHCFRLQGLRNKGKPYARRTHGCRHRLSACQSGQQMNCFRRQGG